MKNTKTVLKQWATKILSNVSDYDYEESAIAQYGNDPEWQKFFSEMTFSRGWDKIVKEKQFEDDEEAQMFMITMLDNTIEEMK